MAAAFGGRKESAGAVWVAGCVVEEEEWLGGGGEDGNTKSERETADGGGDGGGASEVGAGECAEDTGCVAGNGGMRCFAFWI